MTKSKSRPKVLGAFSSFSRAPDSLRSPLFQRESESDRHSYSGVYVLSSFLSTTKSKCWPKFFRRISCSFGHLNYCDHRFSKGVRMLIIVHLLTHDRREAETLD